MSDDQDAGRRAVINAMGWSDDRHETGEYAGAMWELAGEVALAVRVAGGTLPTGPSQGDVGVSAPVPGGRKIPDEQLDALVEQVREGVEPVYDAVRTALRSAYSVGYAAALGYEITVEDDQVRIGGKDGL